MLHIPTQNEKDPFVDNTMRERRKVTIYGNSLSYNKRQEFMNFLWLNKNQDMIEVIDIWNKFAKKTNEWVFYKIELFKT